MQLASITDIVIFLVFVAAFMVFSLSPAIWLSEKLQNRYGLTSETTNFLTLLLTILFSILASYYLYL